MMAAKLDDYVIQRRLAPALFGDVLLCQHKPTGDLVAVKRVLQSAANAQLTLASNKKVRENVALERALYHQLNRVGGHRNVLRLRDEIEFDGYLYLVSDFCARGELYELVSAAEDGKLPLATTRRYLRQIAGGVQFLHANGFAHRDLSLENVLVTDDDQCQVCDFGLAASTAKPSRETVGKLFYMAPEVLAGVQYDATKADVWSLGVMLFIMLVGAPPVETASASDARFRLISNKGIRKLVDRWGLTDELPAAALDLLAGMLEVDPEQRVSMGDVVAHPFLLRSSAIGSPLQQRIAAHKTQVQTQTRAASPAKQETPQPTASYSSASVPSMYSARPESDGIERSGCRLFFHKIHRFFSRRHNKRVMAVNRSPGASKRAHAKRYANAA
ncbi:CAMK protein kinase [Phytophthora cinnamomi]|uniref:CAMK protein kinase n=1 Tax=Phytophthora cinnamomi TaxID=4785 RepID=UPI00355A0C9C|nr:CAMK protein kinase [Phytophthora cinnamomi]